MKIRKPLYVLLLTLVLVTSVYLVVSADINVPNCTDTPQPPVTETRLPPPTETSVPPVTEISPPISEPTPTVEVDPTATETLRPGVTPTKEKHKPTPTWDCAREYNPDKCLAPTGSGEMPTHIKLGLLMISTVILVFLIALVRRARNVYL